ncbi:MAG TPA: hypothetical protein VGV41_19560 [Pseudolabrys sp.]|uniref:hypothetical protein n=1 Tax=Pseudolabrys sp. TaxID=1960880 RepID=UPI002DDCA399|nr:hypothetical protein [Pseudolabrys sp.]HEV2630827.1 hypothetical protein [Pseudolabrys sp.]
MAEVAGWTLREAVRRTVDPDLLKQCVSAERDWRRAGARHLDLADDAETRDRQNEQLQLLRDAQLNAAKSVGEALRAHLISGQLAARGRRGGPLAEIVSVPASAWKLLTFTDFRRSVATEPAPDKTAIYDVRIVPALWADDALLRLTDQPLLRAFDLFVFNDPQVASLRKTAIARGGKPRTVGFQSRLYHAYWYVDHGTERDTDPAGFLLDGEPRSRVAEDALRDRFRRIIKPLIDGEIVAEAALSGQGALVEISPAMWLRKTAVLDLYQGDFYDRYPDPSGDGEERVAPLYLSLMLRRPKTGSAEKLHVKPIDHVDVRPATTASTSKTHGKGIRWAEDQHRIEHECYTWLADMMRKSPNRRTATNGELLAAARAKWPISERSFSAVRKRAIAETGAHAWRVAGATPKSPQPNRRGD